MPMQDEQRRAYLRRAGVSQQQIEDTVGTMPINEASLLAGGQSRAQGEQVRVAVRQVMTDATIIAAKYDAIANDKKGESVPANEIATDRGYLEELFAVEYTLNNPFGGQQNRMRIIDAILQGTIDYDGMGKQGFEALSQSLYVHGDTAITTGDYRMKATGHVKNATTGELASQDLSATYVITNTYVNRDRRWQAAISQMTVVPAKQTFVLTSDG
jgi:hypothetical protein